MLRLATSAALLMAMLFGCRTSPSTPAQTAVPPPEQPCSPDRPDICEGWCDRGMGDACRHAGLAYARGDEAELDPERARDLLGRGCDNGDPPSCGELALLTGDRPRAVALHQQGCDGDYAKSCFVLGSVALADGRMDEAKALFGRGCGLEDSSSCQLAKDVALLEAARAPDCDPADLEACEEACERGSAKSCARLAQAMEEKVEKPDLASAVRFHELACARGESDSCVALGRRFLEGRGVDANVREALKWLGLGCSLGNDQSCELASKWSVP